ncbi:unnamed protein product [Rotaria sp. Silwood2]|nr:unnamed protein product [Rotaria sp. Silwood2]
MSFPPSIIIQIINDLIKIGVKHILIINLPPFETYPATTVFNVPDLLKKLTFDLNNNLLNSVRLLQTNHSKSLIYFKYSYEYQIIWNK